MKHPQDFTQGSIFSPLIRFALPVLMALFLQTMYGAVDLLVVGQFAQAADVSAVSTGSQLMHSLTVVVTGLAMGLTVLVGRKIGEGRKQEAGEIIGSGLWLFGLLAALLSIFTATAAPLLTRLMQAPKEAVWETTQYIAICGGGILFIVAYNLVGSVFRGIGDSKMPLCTVAIACVLNIVGDLLLIGVFQMGAAGAAWATVFAQAVSVILSLLIIQKRPLPFALTRRELKARPQHIKETLKLGTPIALQDLLVSISFLVIIAIVNDLGLTPSAGVGVAEKLCGFLMLVPSCYMQAMAAFVAQNMGACKPKRARKALWCGVASSLAVGIVIAWATYFHGDVLAGLFAKDAPIIAAAAEYLKAYAIDTLLVSFLFCFIGYFNGCGSTLFVMLQGLIGAFGVRIPVSFFMSQQTPVSLFHVGLATPASTIIQILLCGWFFGRQQRRLRRSEGSGLPE